MGESSAESWTEDWATEGWSEADQRKEFISSRYPSAPGQPAGSARAVRASSRERRAARTPRSVRPVRPQLNAPCVVPCVGAGARRWDHLSRLNALQHGAK